MGDMTDSSDVLSGLSGDNLRSKRGNFVDIQTLKSLLGKMWLSSQGFGLLLDDSFAFFFKFLIHF